MNSPPQNISAMTDISANIFSVLILILIILLAARARGDLPEAEPLPDISIENDLAGIARTPLASEDLFDLLYERNEKTRSIKIDLRGTAIDIVANGKSEHFNSADDAGFRLRLLATASNHAALGIYVFDNRFYRAVADTLNAIGWAWREVSVPQALRSAPIGKDGESWSAGFSQLITGSIGRARFRAELAQLLEASSARDGSRGGARGAPAAANSSPLTIVQRFWRWTSAALKTVLILAGFVFVVWVEFRHRRMCRLAVR